MQSSSQPWVSGPAEILRHGLSLLEDDSDTNRRLAMIVIDNSVELAIKTFLGLPKRVNGLAISRKAYEEAAESFPRLLSLLESTSSSKLEGIDLGEIEWYHRLRNQLYHEGNGLTVERTKVDVYAQLARLLFKNLFGAEVVPAPATQKRLGGFLEYWIRVEKAVAALTEPPPSKHPVVAERPRYRYLDSLAALNVRGVVDNKTVQDLKRYRDIRNRLVHGERRLEDVLSTSDTSRLAAITEQLEGMVAERLDRDAAT